MNVNHAVATSRSRLRLSLIAVLCAFCLSSCGQETPNQTNGDRSPAPAAKSETATNQTNVNQSSPTPAAQTGEVPKSNHTAMIETDLGKIKIELFDDQAPATTKNFMDLAKSGYYNGLKFHRVINNFMIQGGDPNGNGTGGKTASGNKLPNEIVRNSPLYQAGYARGIVAMANKGIPESAGSQFFIMHQKYSLPPTYTIFGRVTEGMDVVDKIATAPVQGDRPVSPIAMKKVTIQ